MRGGPRERARATRSLAPATEEEAIDDLSKALTVEPGNKEVMRELENVRLLQQQDDNGSKAVYQRMLQANDKGAKAPPPP